jgi:hypothetical protein
VIFRLKAKFLSHVVFLLAQRSIGKFLKGATATTDHVAVATFLIT